MLRGRSGGFPRAPAYCATKGGIAQLTKATAVDLGPLVRCNAYAPGAIDTPMAREHIEHAADPAAAEWELTAPQINGRLGAPEEVGKLVCFLASDDAAFLTGGGPDRRRIPGLGKQPGQA